MLKANTTVYPRPNNQTPLDIPTLGLKRYELSNHLGNVLSTVSDLKTPLNTDSDPETDAFDAIVFNQQAYYPFGMIMPELEYTAPGEGNTRFGFNGKENDDEVKGKGAQQDYGFRIYDNKLGRFLSMDPLSLDYPWYTPYQFAGNTPIQAIDLEGAEELKITKSAIGLAAKAKLLTMKSDRLLSLYNSVSQREKTQSHLCYIAVGNLPKSNAHCNNQGQFIGNLKEKALLAKRYQEIQRKFQQKGYELSEEDKKVAGGTPDADNDSPGYRAAYMLQNLGIDYNEVLEAEQQYVSLIIIDVNTSGSEKNGLKVLSHEIKHYKNMLQGKVFNTDDDAHGEMYGLIPGSAEAIKAGLANGSTPTIENTKPNYGDQGKDEAEIDKYYE
jgi:RHS repeat-associated protein